MEFNYNNKSYYLVIINSTNFKTASNAALIRQSRLCDRAFISQEYEKIAYDSLEDDGMYGVFIMNSHHVSQGVIIIDINCSQMDNAIVGNTLHAVELTLLCSNQLTRVPGLFRETLNIVTSSIIPSIKPGTTKVLLNVNSENKKAVQFYTTYGFNRVDGYDNIFSYRIRSSSSRGRTKSSSSRGRTKSSSLRGRTKSSSSRKRFLSSRSRTKSSSS